MSERVDILAFAAHPDDAEFGCGGSLILAADRGLRVAVADLTAGELSSRGTPERRTMETKRATALLGLAERWLIGLPDGGITGDPAQREPVIALIRSCRPRVVLAPYWEDRHPDHGAAGRLLRDACFFAGVRRIGRGAPYRPERLIHYMIHSPFEPSFVIDVTPVWERRQAALLAYASQFGGNGREAATAISGPDFLRAMEARAIHYGAMIGARYGEPFLIRGPLGLSELPLPPGYVTDEPLRYRLF